MHRYRRASAILAVSALAALTSALTPSATAAPTGPPAVTGGATQTWKATRYVDPLTAPVGGGTTYFLTGGPTDQVAKTGGAPTASFATTAPTSSTDAVQLTQPLTADADDPRSPGTAFWEGPFSGRVSGPVSITLHWSTANATSTLVPGDNVAIRVYADPGTDAQKMIGSGTTRVIAVGTTPTAVTSTVQVEGTVAASLLLQVTPLFTDAGQDQRVYYGSTTAPSRFVIPTGVVPVAAPPSTVPLPDAAPLTLAATYIGRKAAEPTLGVTQAGNAFITAADFDGISPANPRTLIYASYDGSTTYEDVTPVVAGQTYPPATLDPYIYVDQETNRIYSDDLLVGCSLLQWSDDEGKTWSTGNPLACDGPVDDHQTIVVGNPPPGLPTVGYPNVVYYCINKIADAQCARSLDGGTVFSQSGAPAFLGVSAGSSNGDGTSTSPGVCGGLHGHITTDVAGRLYLPKGHCGNPWLAVSEDGGTTWRQTLVHTMATAHTQTAVATDKAGNVYYVWWQAGTNLPYLAVSTDAGRTFGPPLLVGPPGLRAVNFPSVDAGEPGHVVISYPGTTVTDPTNPARAWNYYVLESTNALAAQPVFRSSTANALADPVHRGVCLGRCAGMYDFLDVIYSPAGEIWGAMVDTCTGPCAQLGPAATELAAAERPTDAQGVVVRELASRVAAPVTQPGTRPVTGPVAQPPAAQPVTLPTTGNGPALPLAAAGLLALAAVAAHRRGAAA